MSGIILSQALIQSFVEATEQFPVSFDDAWQWAGYTRKENALQKLRKHFIEDLDYSCKWCKTPEGGRPSLLIALTVECFKMFSMMAGTEKGKEVRKYFLECEKIAKTVVPQLTVQEQLMLPSAGLIAAREVAEIEELLSNNPRLAQACVDNAMNRVLEKALPAATVNLRGVVEIAHEMGYKTDLSSRVKLGKFVVSQGFVAQKEDRLCNGVMTAINCYSDTPELRAAIAAFWG